jgi:2-hydroxy-3-oxopropionate reductase
MGGPMSGHLVKAGHTVIGFNRSAGPVERLVAAGGEGPTGVAEAVREADVIITMVPDHPMSMGWRWARAASTPMPDGAIHVDLSSIRPDVSARLAEAGKAAGVRVMDAPVSGGETGAVEAPCRSWSERTAGTSTR